MMPLFSFDSRLLGQDEPLLEPLSLEFEDERAAVRDAQQTLSSLIEEALESKAQGAEVSVSRDGAVFWRRRITISGEP